MNKYEFFPRGAKKPTLSGTPLIEEDKYPEDKTEKDLERHVASALRRHWLDFLKARENRGKPVVRHRGGAHLDGELHPGEPVDASSAGR